MGKTFTRVLQADPESTCKDRWEFVLEETDDGLVIRDLTITGDRGCKGHPLTIGALLRGRTVSEIDVDALADAACVRDLSCGQTLGNLLTRLKRSAP